MTKIYLDHSATTPVDRRVFEAMAPFFCEEFGNPSSIHAFGRSAKVALETAREQIAQVIGATPGEIVFTGGGSEADNLAIIGVAESMVQKGKHVITNRTEHHAVLHTFEALEKRGFDVTYVDCDEHGMIRAETIANAIRPDTTLISIMHVNNEVGTVNPIAEMGAIARAKGILFFTDAVQSFGKIPIDVKQMNVDMLSASAHKIYGPKGVGCLYLRRGVRIPPMILGGSQERGQRAGTENIPGIVGFGKAAEICRTEMTHEMQRLAQLRDELWRSIKEAIPGAIMNGHPTERLPGHLNVSFEGIGGDELLMSLDMDGIAVSTGSACTSGAISGSHVLKAMKLSPERFGGAIRLTLGRHSQSSDFPQVVRSIQQALTRYSKAVI